jgi:hypothetical protein
MCDDPEAKLDAALEQMEDDVGALLDEAVARLEAKGEPVPEWVAALHRLRHAPVVARGGVDVGRPEQHKGELRDGSRIEEGNVYPKETP